MEVFHEQPRIVRCRCRTFSIGMRMATLCGYCWTKLTPPTGREGVVG